MVWVRARNQEAIEPKASELAPQCRDPDRALRGFGPILEGLIETFEHPPSVGPVRLRRNMGAVLAQGNRFPDQGLR
ncbi:MAG: hypothetical protein ACREDA_12100, partial [Methylocella sp.]